LTPYHSTLIYEDNNVLNNEYFSKFELAAEKLGFNAKHITRAFAIHNPGLEYAFNFHRNKISSQHRANPQLFKKDHWKNFKDSKKREGFFNYFNSICKKFPWNDGDKVHFFSSFSFFFFFFF